MTYKHSNTHEPRKVPKLVTPPLTGRSAADKTGAFKAMAELVAPTMPSRGRNGYFHADTSEATLQERQRSNWAIQAEATPMLKDMLPQTLAGQVLQLAQNSTADMVICVQRVHDELLFEIHSWDREQPLPEGFDVSEYTPDKLRTFLAELVVNMDYVICPMRFFVSNQKVLHYSFR